MRDYNYRIGKQEKFVKQRIMNIAYKESHYDGNYFHRYGGRTNSPNCGKKDPEDKWFNYLGEYTGRYRKSYDFQTRKFYTEWGEQWKDKYLTRRSKLKENKLKRINEQVGQKYYIFNKQ
tara:strand:- start:68040 stop:68396 length:357 start_codon:yes stop_codon:yes gene_type:complete